MPTQRTHSQITLFSGLLFASLVLTGMVVARAVYSGVLSYRFLIWNLFLAWLPLVFAFMGYRAMEKRPLLLSFTVLWLLFFPNALYLVTDLIHLRDTGVVPLWFDAIMMFSFALTGLLLGLLSLYLMHTLITHRFGRGFGWLFAVMSLAISGYGVYVGRFLRWNSWDIFAHPIMLLRDMLYSLVHPQMVLKTYTVSLLLSAVFMFTYLIFFSLSRIPLEQRVERGSRHF